jgi:hypothetical protein
MLDRSSEHAVRRAETVFVCLRHLHFLYHLLGLGFDSFLVVSEVLHHPESYFVELSLRQLREAKGRVRVRCGVLAQLRQGNERHLCSRNGLGACVVVRRPEGSVFRVKFRGEAMPGTEDLHRSELPVHTTNPVVSFSSAYNTHLSHLFLLM